MSLVLVKVMNKYLRGTEKSKLIYNYSALDHQRDYELR
jgi:hypothetical protein